jgi:hypothetical protein
VGTTAGGLNDRVIQPICRCVYAFIRDAGQRRRIDLLVLTTQAADLLLNRGLLSRKVPFCGPGTPRLPAARALNDPFRICAASSPARGRQCGVPLPALCGPAATISAWRALGSRNQGGVEPPLARDPLQLRDAPVLEGKS